MPPAMGWCGGTRSTTWCSTVRGRLRTERLDPTVVAAVRVTALLAFTQRTVISTGLLRYGLGVVGSRPLTDSLLEQGDAGTSALNRLSLSTEASTNLDRFSSRTRKALERSIVRAGTGTAGDAVLLGVILAEVKSSARDLLVHHGVDPDRLLRDHGGDVEPDAEAPRNGPE